MGNDQRLETGPAADVFKSRTKGVNAGRNPHFFGGMWMGADDLGR
jgi:hypothetical protein